MSAFIVDEFTMHRVLMGVHWAGGRGQIDREEMTKLGRKWYAMNREAVIQRYRDDSEFAVPNYEFKLLAPRNPVDYVKAMQCLVYQCSEGDVPDTQEYANLRDVLNVAMGKLIRNMPGYESAAWDGEWSNEERARRSACA